MSLIPFLSILVLTCLAADNTTDYIHQLEQKISELESHTQASEQKQAAVLASILSKLQSQEEKFQEHMLLVLLQNDLHNNTQSTTDSQHVAFEARTTTDKTSTLIKFNSVPVNVGGGYNENSGTFKAPTTGIYHFWFTVYVSHSHTTELFINTVQVDVVKLIAGNVTVGPSYGGYVAPAHVQPTGHNRHDIREVQGLHVVPMTAGDTAYVQLMSSATVKLGSSFGGMLIG